MILLKDRDVLACHYVESEIARDIREGGGICDKGSDDRTCV